MTTALTIGHRCTALALATALAGLVLGGCREPGAGAPTPSEGEPATPSTSRFAPTVDQPGRTVEQLEEAVALQRTKRHEDPDEIVRELALQPGQVVADVGCGIGAFSFRFAEAVGAGGKVFALDIDPYFLEVLEEERGRRANPLDEIIEARVTDREDPGLEAASVDLVFFGHIDIFAFATMRERYRELLGHVHAALRPTGRVAVLQWMGIDEPNAQPDHVQRNLEAAGFVETRRIHYEEFGSYLQLFEKKPEPEL